MGPGVPDREIAEFLGHSRVSVTRDVYQHGTPAGRRAAWDRLDAWLSGSARRLAVPSPESGEESGD